MRSRDQLKPSKMNKYIKHVIKLKTTNVLSAGMGVPDALNLAGTWLG